MSEHNASPVDGASDLQVNPDGTQRSPSPIPPMPKLPPAPAPHIYGQGYSANNKIPTVSDYSRIQKSHEQQAEEYARIMDERRAIMGDNNEDESSDSDYDGSPRPSTDTAGRKRVDSNLHSAKNSKKKAHAHEAPTEKQRLMDQMNANQEKPTDRFRKARKGERRVRDPITGGEIIVRDANPRDFDPARTKVRGSNILYHQFPPPQPESLKGTVGKLHMLQFGVLGGVAVLWFFVAFGNGFWNFTMRSTICCIVGGGLMSALSIVERSLEKEITAIRMDQHRARGQAMSPPYPESTEWLNGLIKLIWGLIDPAMFIGVADMVEDILQQSLPSFVDAVRITDLGQGTNPLRILSIRALPDQPGDREYPHDEWINEGRKDIKLKDTAGTELDEEEAGDYYNFECAFSYTALPGQGSTTRAKNIHLLIEFFLGAFDWFHIPVPLWIQIEEIYGIVRLRVQFIPEPPFVRNLTFALCGVPAVEVSAIPMSKHLPNVLDLPFVSSFVRQGIAAGTAELSVPKSMTINLKEMLSGTGQGDTRAIGVFVITIHYCEGLSAQDDNGLSDPYIVLAYAKYGRPLYSSRIILEDLNPVYEETCVLLCTIDEVKAEEELCAMLWDSDKLSADDLVGRVQIPIKELMDKPNQMFRREDGLMGFEDDNEMPGKLNWSIGYFEKVPLDKKLERMPTLEEAKAAMPESTAPSKEMRPGDKAPNPAHHDLPPPEADVSRTRPDPRWPSGVLSIILHQINNLERQHLEGKGGDDREGEAGQDTDDPSQQTENLPSGYGEFIVNDDLVYRTRVKQYTTNPYFEAGTEVFIRDFTTAQLRIVIRDSRLREADPILGIITLELADVFAEASSVVRTYPLEEGQGFGKANVSLAFRSMKTTIPRNLRGWSTGTLIISNVRLTPDVSKNDSFPAKEMALTVATHESTEKMSRKQAEVEGDTIAWDSETLYLPVFNRYQSSLTFEFGRKGLSALVGKGKPEALAVMWLQDLTDDVEGDVELPVIMGKNLPNLRANVINDQTYKHHPFEVVGKMTARIKFSAGIDLEHENLQLGQSRRHALEAYLAVEGEAEIAQRQQSFKDDGHIDKHEQREIDRAHKRQLESRGRGMAQVKVYRSAKWMGRGLLDRLPGRKKTREPTVQTEA